jgi:hypothetical protein
MQNYSPAELLTKLNQGELSISPPMIRLHKPIAAFAFLLLAAISSSCTPGGPGARSLNEPLNLACADGFKARGDGSCSF